VPSGPLLAADLTVAVLIDLGEHQAALALTDRAQLLLGKHLLAGRELLEAPFRA
jgi:hypothetical protein